MSVVLIAGSRTLVGQPFYDHMYAFLQTIPQGTIILSGMAKGVDIYAHHAAIALGYFVKEMPIEDEEWKVFGRRMGRIRNYTLGIYVQKAKGSVHLFINNGVWTNGTETMRKICEEFAIPYEVHDCHFSPEELEQRVINWYR